MQDHRPAANAAILYRPDGYDTGRDKLMGRQAAGEGFLRGLHRHSGVDAFYCYTTGDDLTDHFAKLMAGMGNTRPIHWLDEANPASPETVGALYLPGPALARHAWRRRAVGQRRYSITGVTHTTASTRAMDAITEMLTAPVQSWDALICTSAVVRDTVEVLLGEQQEYLAARFGATMFPRPQLPVIPLGVDTGEFTPDVGKREEARAALGIATGDVVLLFVGRLSFHAKAHPMPMYLGIERAAKAWAGRGGGRVHLIQAGWFANEQIERVFKQGARQFCPSVNAIFVDGRRPAARGRAWAAADIFTSLSDNFQETFGLTPIEAMAAGLPSVVSDWNGYRDTVRDEVDGIRVPTLMPRAGLGADLAERHSAEIDTYDTYCGLTSQMVAIDPERVGAAYLRLIEDAGLRHKMGAAARERALEVFDWSVVIGQYQALWEELADLRKAGDESAPMPSGRPSHPSRPDPFVAFASYATDVLSAQHVVRGVEGGDSARLRSLLSSNLFAFFKPVAPRLEDCERIFASLRVGERTVGDLLSEIPADRRPSAERGLVWLAKLGLISIAPPR